MKLNRTLILTVLLAAPVFGQAGNPLVGRWDFNVTGPRAGAVWLGVTEKAGAFDVWYQPAGGNVYQVKDFKVQGSHISVVITPAADDRPAMTWELDAAGDKITGVQKRGDNNMPLNGVRSPELKRSAPRAWTKPEALFNGKNLDGWEPIGNPANSHWSVKDGTLFNAEVSLNRLEWRGQPIIQAIVRDITERKQAELEREKLEAKNRQLQKAESLGRMAGAIAHHFNNQLQTVMLGLELALDDLPPDARPVESLMLAMGSSRKAAEVSGLMLTYLGQTAAKRDLLDLSAVCQRSLPLLRAVMPRSLTLETELPAPGPAICADPNQIQHVLANLVTNAWEASGPTQGVIRLTVKTVAAARIPAVHRFPVGCIPRDTDHACLEVADAGCGISEQDVEKIFDPFFTSKFSGRGMGLAVVLGVVRSTEGVITVESGRGRGSVFRVFLPVAAAAVPEKPVHIPQAPTTRGRGMVLVVEDEADVRHGVTRALKHSGFEVLAAEDGVQALEIFRQNRGKIGCVLCDLTMPRMDGWQTLVALRQLEPGIPVIMASGYSEAQVMAGEHPELPQVLLHKPYELRQLREAISQVMRTPAT